MSEPLRPERKHPLIPHDDREPIDDPFLPLDPGDDPDEKGMKNFEKL